MNVRFYLSYDIKIALKSHFCDKKVIILSLCTQHCYGCHNISPKSITTSGLSILLHGLISLPDSTSPGSWQMLFPPAIMEDLIIQMSLVPSFPWWK